MNESDPHDLRPTEKLSLGRNRHKGMRMREI